MNKIVNATVIGIINVTTNKTLHQTLHHLVNNTAHRKHTVAVKSHTFTHSIVLHNETFGALGLQHDIEAPMWSGLLVGTFAACVCCVCLSMCYTSYMRDTYTQSTYENLPLIVIRHGRR